MILIEKKFICTNIFLSETSGLVNLFFLFAKFKFLRKFSTFWSKCIKECFKHYNSYATVRNLQNVKEFNILFLSVNFFSIWVLKNKKNVKRLTVTQCNDWFYSRFFFLETSYIFWIKFVKILKEWCQKLQTEYEFQYIRSFFTCLGLDEYTIYNC